MAKKSIKEAAAVGTSIFDQIASGNTQGTENIQGTKNIQEVNNATNIKNASGRPPKYDEELVRLNFKVPVKIRDYLQEAAYRKSTPRHMVSLTEYFCDLVYQDMERHKND